MFCMVLVTFHHMYAYETWTVSRLRNVTISKHVPLDNEVALLNATYNIPVPVELIFSPCKAHDTPKEFIPNAYLSGIHTCEPAVGC